MKSTHMRSMVPAAVCAVFLLGSTLGMAQDLMRTSFEASGDPDQDYTAGESIKNKTNWSFLDPGADPNLALITDAEHQEGAQALQLSQGAAVDRTIDGAPDGEVVWIQAYFKGPGSSAQTPTYPSSPEASSIVHFSATDGIRLLDGNGAGDGNWVAAPDYGTIDAGAWYQVTLRQDYGFKNWDAFVDGTKQGSALGFRDNGVTRLSGFMNLSDTTSYLDNIWVKGALRGDSNGDLALDSADLVRAIQIVAAAPEPALNLIWGGNADVSGSTGQPDGQVDGFDVTRISDMILGI